MRQKKQEKPRVEPKEDEEETTLIVENLPREFRDLWQVADLLPREVKLTGMRYRKDRTELYFSSRGHAKQAAQNLEGTKVHGKRLKVFIEGEEPSSKVAKRSKRETKHSKHKRRLSSSSASSSSESHSKSSSESVSRSRKRRRKSYSASSRSESAVSQNSESSEGNVPTQHGRDTSHLSIFDRIKKRRD